MLSNNGDYSVAADVIENTVFRNLTSNIKCVIHIIMACDKS